MTNFYVKVSDTDKPYLLDVSMEQKEGYVLVTGIMDSQILALTKFPTKCYLDDNGALVTPNQIPLSVAEQQAQQTNLTIDNLQKQVTDLTSQVNQANADKEALQSQIASLMIEISKLQAPAQTTTTTGGGK